ncbi:cornifelin homolog B-like [Platichthys flesus]|uniref:cornifelin homolog B-like n=1 Tax=Platichthys flesus TaxID=8260 RepID=UPI002DBF2FEB|nr:cornifelin homolog B-like [Platichthys flesus]
MESRKTDEWGSGIFDFYQDVPGCCYSFWCCPCFAATTTKTYGESLFLPLLDMFGIIPPVNMSMRVSLRQRYGIKDIMFKDCLFATCCSPCSWCQMSREMNRRKT